MRIISNHDGTYSVVIGEQIIQCSSAELTSLCDYKKMDMAAPVLPTVPSTPLATPPQPVMASDDDDSIDLDDMPDDEMDMRDIPQAAREKMPKKNFAGGGTSFPIQKPVDVANAARAIGRAKGDPAAVKAKIIAIAKRKGPEFVSHLPEVWK
jgi:hypothetical protein